jgi:hypothetical protein
LASGEEIQQALRAFVAKWSGYAGSERAAGQICTNETIGLTTLYNAADEGAWTDLKALPKELDEAVVDCYVWPRSAAQYAAELVRLLTERNREIAEDARPYDPFGDFDRLDHAMTDRT